MHRWKSIFHNCRIWLVTLALAGSAIPNIFSEGIRPGPLVRFGRITSSTSFSSGMEVRSGDMVLRVTAITPAILRVQMSRNGRFSPNHSWAVLADMQAASAPVHATSAPNTTVGFTTALLQVRIGRDTGVLAITDRNGRVLSQDYPSRPDSFVGQSFKVYKSAFPDEHYYGLGDKPGSLDHRNHAYQLWNTDAYGWEESRDPLYKAIPFFISVRDDGTSYGMFLDNTYRSSFDFTTELRDGISFGAEGGDLDYYFIYGPAPKEVLTHFTDLVGRAPLPPRWAFGFQQSRFSYESEARVRGIARTFRAKQIPVDVIYLDIDYQVKNRPFTINEQQFSTFNRMVEDLKRSGIHLVAITDLHIAQVKDDSYEPYSSGLAADNFVHNPDGSLYIGEVWPGPSVFPEFTEASARKWWGSLYRNFYVERGIDGFWNDMNEPSVFDGPFGTMPLNTVHRIDEPGQPVRTTTHRETHNVYGMENSRATYEGLLALKPNIRPFVLTRASYAGGHRYAVTWTGDNASTWNHLRISTPQLLNLGLSGFSFAGDDVGGFRGSPMPDLLTRWIELGAFNPIYRDHTEKGTADQEPWVHGPQQEAIRKKYIELRYELMPYIYTVAEETSRIGIPMMRPIFLEFPKKEQRHISFMQADTEFLFGPALLVAPQPSELLDDYSVALPEGGWYDYWSSEKVPSDGTVTIQPKLDFLPVFVRAGSIIPQQAVVQSTSEIPKGPLQLRVYPGPKCNGSLYTDDGVTLNFMRGEFLRETYSCQTSDRGLSIGIAPHEGNFHAWWKQINLLVAGHAAEPKIVLVNGAPAEVQEVDGLTSILIDDLPAGCDVELQY